MFKTTSGSARRGLAVGPAAMLLAAVMWLHWNVTDHLDFDHDPMLMRSWLCGVAMIVATCGWSVRHTLSHHILLTLALIFVVGVGARAGSGTRLEHLGEGDQINPWSAFHYYLGSRYFAELGYTDLYSEAIKADRAGSEKLVTVHHIRDMMSYEPVAAVPIRAAPRSPNWSDARWQAFVADVAAVTSFRKRGFWAGPLNDRGYNTSPAWTTIGGIFTRNLDIADPFEQTFQPPSRPVSSSWSARAQTSVV